jgi:type VI secretion system protein ImpL
MFLRKYLKFKRKQVALLLHHWLHKAIRSKLYAKSNKKGATFIKKSKKCVVKLFRYLVGMMGAIKEKRPLYLILSSTNESEGFLSKKARNQGMTNSPKNKEASKKRFILHQNAAFIRVTKKAINLAQKNNLYWNKLLRHINNEKRRYPLEGIIIEINLENHLSQTAEDANAFFEMIKKRVAILSKKIKKSMPLYFVMTHLDIIEGFQPLFHAIPDEEKSEVWGMRVERKEQPACFSAQISTEKIELLKTIESMTHLIALSEDDSYRLLAAMCFYVVFKSALEKLVYSIDKIHLRTNTNKNINILGVYFISEGGRSINDKNRKSYLTESEPPFKECNQKDTFYYGNNTSYFLKNLIPHLLAESRHNRAKGDPRAKYIVLKPLIFISISLCIIFLSYFWLKNLYDAEVKIKNETNILSAQLIKASLSHETNASIYRLIEDGVLFYKRVLKAKSRESFLGQVGVYDNRWLEINYHPYLDQLIEKHITYWLHHTIKKMIVEQSIKWDSSNPEARIKMRALYYGTFKMYLMLSYPNRFSKDFFYKYLTLLLEKRRVKEVPVFDALIASPTFLIFYGEHFQHYKPLAPDLKLIQKVRESLYLKDNILNEYELMREYAIENDGQIHLSDALQEHNQPILFNNDSTPFFYTLKGWENQIKKQLDTLADACDENEWVFHTPLFDLLKKKSVQVLKCANSVYYKRKLYDNYFQEYVTHWNRLLKDLKLKPVSSLGEASQIIHGFNKSDQLQKHLLLIEKNINIQHRQYADLLSDLTKNKISELSGVFPLQKKMAVYSESLEEIEGLLSTLLRSSDQRKASLLYTQQFLTHALDETILGRSYLKTMRLLNQLTFKEGKEVITPLLISPILLAWQTILSEARAELSSQWKDNVYRVYQKRIKKLFNESALGDEPFLSDLRDFFNKKDGLYPSFYRKNIAEQITTHALNISEKKWLGYGLDFDIHALHQLNKMHRFTQGLFIDNKFGFSYRIKVLPSVGIKQIVFYTDKHYLRYQNGPETWSIFSWPAFSEGDVSYLKVTPIDGNALTIETSSRMGLFNLLNKAKLTALSHSSFKAEWGFSLKARKYKINLIFEDTNHYNILSQFAFNSVGLPRHLFLKRTESFS